MLTLFAFEADAERLLESFLDGIEAAEWMILGAGAGLTRIRSEEPGNVFGLREWGTVKHGAREEVREEDFVPGES